MQKGQMLDAQKIGDKKTIRIPDSVLQKIDAKVGDFLVFYYNNSNVIVSKGEIS